MTGSILVSLYSDLNYDCLELQLILILTASYITYQYPWKCQLIPQQYVGFQESSSMETSFIFVSHKKCSVKSCFPKIHFYGNVLVLFSLAMGLHMTIHIHKHPTQSHPAGGGAQPVPPKHCQHHQLQHGAKTQEKDKNLTNLQDLTLTSTRIAPISKIYMAIDTVWRQKAWVPGYGGHQWWWHADWD
jgi:hypothetical protein